MPSPLEIIFNRNRKPKAISINRGPYVMEMADGENAEITPSDLTLVKAGTRQQWQAPSGTKRVCANCGYETQEDFAYCPKCGGRL